MKPEVRIAIGGGFRSGKTSVADYLEKHYGMVPFAFGDELKNGFHYEYPHIPREPKSRKGYQMYGQLKRYVFGEDYWLTQTLSEVDRMRIAAHNYNLTGSEIGFRPLITDVRQPNEYARMPLEGYKVIKVLAPDHLVINRAQAAGDQFDISDLYHEVEVYSKTAPADYTVVNDGTLEQLYEQIDMIMAGLGVEKVQ